jgi:hypothetical protein
LYLHHLEEMLQGIELIDCAKANAKQGVEVAAALSGYENNEDLFIENLQAACQQIGVNVSELGDLITDQQIAKENVRVIEVAPDTAADL